MCMVISVHIINYRNIQYVCAYMDPVYWIQIICYIISQPNLQDDSILPTDLQKIKIVVTTDILGFGKTTMIFII